MTFTPPHFRTLAPRFGAPQSQTHPLSLPSHHAQSPKPAPAPAPTPVQTPAPPVPARPQPAAAAAGVTVPPAGVAAAAVAAAAFFVPECTHDDSCVHSTLFLLL